MKVMEDSFKDEKEKWDLVRIARDCESMLKKAGIPIQNIVEINTIRDSYIFGRIRGTRKNNFDLDIAIAYRNPRYELVEVKTVICHLLLHTVEDCMNLSEKWIEYAEKADKECGLHIIEHAASRPKAGENWSGKSTNVKTASNRERCCFLDYKEKLEELTRECSDELKKIGHVSEVIFGASFAYGSCRKNGDNDFTIEVAKRYANEDADRVGLKHLLCHELLHTCPEDDSWATQAHGPKWREMARKVEKEYGYKLMSQSDTDAVRQTSGTPKRSFVCPNCGGYHDVYGKKDGEEGGYCQWCDHRMNPIKLEDMGILHTIYFMVGEWRDKMKLAGIPIGTISGIGFVPADKSAGLHDNWNGCFSIDLPERFRKEEMLNSDELKVYLCQELVRTCKGCGDDGVKWNEYMKKVERALGISIS